MNTVTEELRQPMENSPYGRRLGFRLLELTRGYAKVAVTLGPEHSNFLGMIDGGLVMSLADYAFACSCNTFGQVRVAAQFSTNFISAPVLMGELIAEGRTIHAGRTIALTEITIMEATGRLIAKATGIAITKQNNNLTER
jgi:acyl-CoA thioesterase